MLLVRRLAVLLLVVLIMLIMLLVLVFGEAAGDGTADCAQKTVTGLVPAVSTQGTACKSTS